MTRIVFKTERNVWFVGISVSIWYLVHFSWKVSVSANDQIIIAKLCTRYTELFFGSQIRDGGQKKCISYVPIGLLFSEIWDAVSIHKAGLQNKITCDFILQAHLKLRNTFSIQIPLSLPFITLTWLKVHFLVVSAKKNGGKFKDYQSAKNCGPTYLIESSTLPLDVFQGCLPKKIQEASIC